MTSFQGNNLLVANVVVVSVKIWIVTQPTGCASTAIPLSQALGLIGCSYLAITLCACHVLNVTKNH